MADGLDANKMAAIQKLLQSDPKALEKVINQITPDQVSAALNLFGSLDPKTQGMIGGLISGLKGTGNK